MKKYFLLLILLTIILVAGSYHLLATPASGGQDTSCGVIWHEPVILANVHSQPSIAVQGDTIHVTWRNLNHAAYFRSVNNGVTWEPERNLWDSTTLYNGENKWLLANGSNLYMIFVTRSRIDDTSGFAFRRSTDRGTHWDSIHFVNNIRDGSPYDAAIYKDTIALSFQKERVGDHWPRVVASPDGGEHWYLRPDTILGYDVRVALTSNTLHVVYTKAFNGAIFNRRSNDIGLTYIDDTMLSMENQSSMPSVAAYTSKNNSDEIFTAWIEARLGCGNAWSCNISSRKSNDNGETWDDEKILTEQPFGTFNHVAVRENILLAAWEADFDTAYATFARISVDGGENWCPVRKMHVGGAMSAVAISKNAVHIVSAEDGETKVYYWRGEIITDAVERKIENNKPKEVMLEQNYPDPFNPITDIEYWLIDESNVTLKVYNINGQEVTTLINKHQQAGKHNAVWNAIGKPSGWYMYQLMVTDNRNKAISLTKKMILLK